MKAADESTCEQLRSRLGIGRLLARALACRGIVAPVEAQQFLDHDLAALPDPFAMRDMDRAVVLVREALASGARVRIYGDYDVDGVCATALLVRALRGLGGEAASPATGGLRSPHSKVDWYIPHRLDEGYGLNEEAVRQAHADGVGLLVTVDCGSTAVAQVALARQLGMQVLVTDHHQPGDELPEAPVLNPWRPDCDYPFRDLAGVGVAFKLVSALARAYDLPAGRELRFLDLVCLGTVGDVVPLLSENRILVQHGLRQLANTRKRGLAALMEAARIGHRGAVGARQVAFGLAPRINAAGRMEHAQAAVRLLLTRDEAEARTLAAQLSEHNKRRRDEERQILSEAEKRVSDEVDLAQERVIVLSSENWHAGVIGIVASRLVERYHRPALLIALSDGVGKGSGRSVPGLNLWETLRDCTALLTRYGGHHYAAGFGLPEEHIGALRQQINKIAEDRLAMDDLVRHIEVDGEAELAELGLESVVELNRLAPFGMSNPAPVVVTRGLRVKDTRRVGDGSHLSLVVRDAVGRGAGAIWFGAGGLENALRGAVDVDLCHRPRLDEWNGQTRVRLQVEDAAVLKA
jgi:single-stranded-DNA-specific exonuclease